MAPGVRFYVETVVAARLERGRADHSLYLHGELQGTTVRAVEDMDCFTVAGGVNSVSVGRLFVVEMHVWIEPLSQGGHCLS